TSTRRTRRSTRRGCRCTPAAVRMTRAGRSVGSTCWPKAPPSPPTMTARSSETTTRTATRPCRCCSAPPRSLRTPPKPARTCWPGPATGADDARPALIDAPTPYAHRYERSAAAAVRAPARPAGIALRAARALRAACAGERVPDRVRPAAGIRRPGLPSARIRRRSGAGEHARQDGIHHRGDHRRARPALRARQPVSDLGHARRIRRLPGRLVRALHPRTRTRRDGADPRHHRSPSRRAAGAGRHRDRGRCCRGPRSAVLVLHEPPLHRAVEEGALLRQRLVAVERLERVEGAVAVVPGHTVARGAPPPLVLLG